MQYKKWKNLNLRKKYSAMTIATDRDSMSLKQIVATVYDDLLRVTFFNSATYSDDHIKMEAVYRFFKMFLKSLQYFHRMNPLSIKLYHRNAISHARKPRSFVLMRRKNLLH